MSNVLIGIIGVILFIGLALAGALFLGPRFQEVSSNSQASAVMTGLKQVSDAASLWGLQNGKNHVPSTGTAFLQPDYLKTAPSNPAANGSNTYFWSYRFDNNIFPYWSPEPIYAAKFVLAPVGLGTDAKARSICLAIQKSVGQSTIPTDTTAGDPQPNQQAGCLLGTGVSADGQTTQDWFVAYTRIASASQSITQSPD